MGLLPGSRLSPYEIVAPDGSGQPALLLEGPRMHPNHYSPDGRYLVYMTFEKGGPSIGVTIASSASPSSGAAEAKHSSPPTGNGWPTHSATCFCNPLPEAARTFRFQPAVARNRVGAATDATYSFFIGPDRKLMAVSIDIRGGELFPGAPRPLFQTHVTAPRFADTQYDVTRDASRFIVNSLKREAPLTLVSGWPALLRR